MKKNNFIIALMLTLFVFPFNIKALSYGGCDYSEIAKLKSYVSNVNLSYDYRIIDNKAYFDITVSNMVPQLYFVDSVTKQNYMGFEGTDITVRDVTNTSGRLTFYSALENCMGIKIGSKYYNLPTYNFYYLDPLCEENRDFALCKKWAEVNYSYDDFEKLINEYNSSTDEVIPDDEILVEYETTIVDKIVSFYTKYYYIILIGIIVVCVTIMIISKRKNRIDI